LSPGVKVMLNLLPKAWQHCVTNQTEHLKSKVDEHHPLD